MEMLNIPPVQPQTNPMTAPKGKTDKGENASFQNVLGKANQNAQKDQHKGVKSSTEEEGTELDGTAKLGNGAAEDSQPVVSAEGEEQTTEPSAEDITPVELAIGAIPSLPAEAIKTEPIPKAGNGPIVTENTKSVSTGPLPSEAPLQSAQAEVTSATPEASESSGTPEVISQKVAAENAMPGEAKLKVLSKDVVSVTEKPAAPAESTATKVASTPAATAAMAAETLPATEKTVADSALPAGLAHRTESVDPRQKMAGQVNVASTITQVNPAETSKQTDLVSNESSKKTGLMESSLGSLLQEVRPLREPSHGRLNANLNRSETASIAISGQESAQVVAGTQSEDSHLSFASKQENGFSALQSDAATNGANSAITATTFEAVLESGMHGSTTVQQGNQPLQAASAESGSIRLSSGEFLSENQVVNQVLERISVERAENQSRIIVKMNPEELGEVKLALTMEKDQLRAQLLTQNHQVREILEKHLPKLHEALSQQGVKLEDIQVGVDSNRHSGQEAFANHRQPDSFRRHFNTPAGNSNIDPVHPVTASARSVSTEGLSLRI